MSHCLYSCRVQEWFRYAQLKKENFFCQIFGGHCDFSGDQRMSHCIYSWYIHSGSSIYAGSYCIQRLNYIYIILWLNYIYSYSTIHTPYNRYRDSIYRGLICRLLHSIYRVSVYLQLLNYIYPIQSLNYTYSGSTIYTPLYIMAWYKLYICNL